MDSKSRGYFQLEPKQTYSESASHALLGLFFYSCLMFILPLLVFFGSQQLLQPPYSHVAPIILAVVVVNIIIAAYVVKAFKEEAKERPKSIMRIMEERKKKE